VDVHAVLLADVERELADGLQEWEPLDVAHGATDLPPAREVSTVSAIKGPLKNGQVILDAPAA